VWSRYQARRLMADIRQLPLRRLTLPSFTPSDLSYGGVA
jgi:hypothetical protein